MNMPQRTEFDSIFLTGQQFHQQGDLPQAADCYRQALKQQPDNSEVMHALGLLSLQQKNYAEAINYLEKADQKQNRNALLKKDLATAYYFAGRYSEAKSACRSALNIMPGNADIIYLLALSLKKIGKFSESITQFEKFVDANTVNADVHAEYADTLSLHNVHSKAIKHASAALQLDKNNLLAMKAFARALYNSGKLKEAITVYDKLIALEPDNVDHYLANARACQTLGYFKLTRQFLDKALSLEPENRDSLFLASVFENSVGNHGKAIELIDKALKQFPDDDNYLGQKAKSLYIVNRKKEAFEIIRDLVEDKTTFNTSHAILYIKLSPEFGSTDTAEKLFDLLSNMEKLGPLVKGPFYFIAGDFFNRVNKYEQAFDCYQQANRLFPREFKPETIKTHYRYITELFSPALYESVAFENDNDQPIFILGMPRSGTSLTEKIISRHSQVTEMGELPHIGNLVGDLSGQTKFSVSTSAQILSNNENLNRLYQQYLSRVNETQPITTAHFTDKMPDNFLFLGFIKLIFPQAKIIHCNREAIDVCWSCYINSFGSTGHAYSYDLDSLGYYYNYYLKIMQHWKTLFAGQFYELQYEALVENPELETRKLIEYCGLPWEDACLEHHKATTHTHTASFEQVRQPIYKTSQQKWKPYEQHIKPLFDALEKYRDEFQ